MVPQNLPYLLTDSLLELLGVGLASLLFLFFLPVFGFVVAILTVALNPSTEETVAKLSGGFSSLFVILVFLSVVGGASDDLLFISVSGLGFCGGLLAASLFWILAVSDEEHRE